MFARRNRLSFRQKTPRKTFSTPLFIIRYDKNEENRLLCAVVVGKKVDKRAVVRNKIKRQLVALIKEQLSLQTPLTIVLFAKKPILEAASDTTKEELRKAFSQL